MKIFRQLGTWGSTVALAPLLWLLSCALARTLAQNAFDSNIVPITKAFRAPDGPRVQSTAFPTASRPVTDPMVLAELQKYLHIWSLEPGASPTFPDARRFPWCWNPFRPSALILRLKQKQAFLLPQHHEVERRETGSGRAFYYLLPDPQAALGGRQFQVEAEGARLLRAVER